MTDPPYTDSLPTGASSPEEAHPAPTLLDPVVFETPPDPTPVGVLPEVPGYTVLARLGQGGMGVVFRARHHHLDRFVALKMIRDGLLATSAHVARFQAEARAVARLQHPHIVQIFEIGDHQGRPYFALELVEGGNLSQRLARGPLDAKQAAYLVEVLARAMQYAHDQGIIHRDLKPANILLMADDAPKIADFGLAKEAQAEIFLSHSASGTLLGTPSYMAPEQAWGRAAEVGPAVDVYSLGAILYECLTGKPPFLAGSLMEVLDELRHRDPVPPRSLNPGVPRDLETICLKCLAKEPGQRYASAEELARDLHRFQTGEAIQGRRVGTVERAWKWMRRRAALVVVSSLLLLTLTLTALGAWYATTWARQQQETARADLQRAHYPTLLQQAQQALAQQRPMVARQLLEQCPADVRGWEWDLLHALALGQAPARLGGLNQPVQAVIFDPLRKHLYAATEAGLRIWDQESLAELPPLLTGGRVQDLALSADGRYLAALVEANAPPAPARLFVPISRRWLAPVRGMLQTFPILGALGNAILLLTLPVAAPAEVEPPAAPQAPPQQMVPPPVLVIPTRRHDVLVWDLVSRTLVVRWICPSGSGFQTPVQIAFQPGGSQLAVLATARSVPQPPIVLDPQPPSLVAFFDLVRPQARPRIIGLNGVECQTLAFAPDGQTLALGTSQGHVHLLDPVTARVRQDLRSPTGGSVVSLAYDPQGTRLAAGLAEGHIDIWDSDSGELLHMLPGHSGPVTALQFHPTTPRLFTLGLDGYLRVWDRTSGQTLFTTRVGSQPYVPALSLDGSGELAAVASSPDALGHYGLTILGAEACGKPPVWRSRPSEGVGMAWRRLPPCPGPAVPGPISRNLPLAPPPGEPLRVVPTEAPGDVAVRPPVAAVRDTSPPVSLP